MKIEIRYDAFSRVWYARWVMPDGEYRPIWSAKKKKDVRAWVKSLQEAVVDVRPQSEN